MDQNNSLNLINCPVCEGYGSIVVGDPEDGVEDTCPECNGECEIENPDGYDIFVSERDAWSSND